MNETISINCAEDVLKNAEANTVSVEQATKSIPELLEHVSSIFDEICEHDDFLRSLAPIEKCLFSVVAKIRETASGE